LCLKLDRNKTKVAAAELEKEVGAKTIAASDDMKLDLKEV
jgi:hypothetical protein